MGTLFRNVKYGVQRIFRQPGFALLVIIISALGIGANTAIFSIINKVLLQSLPYRDADRLFFVQQVRTNSDGGREAFSYTRFTYLQENFKSFDEMAAYTGEDFNITTFTEPIRVRGLRVSVDFFRILGITPVQGRTFLPEEDQPGGASVVIISHNLWENYFQGKNDIVGNTVRINSVPYTVVGILPPGLKYINENVDLWVPRVLEYSFFRTDIIRIGAMYLNVVGHLRDGVTQSEAESELAIVTRQYQQAFPGNNDSTNGSILIPMRQQYVEGIRPALIVLFAAVGCILLIACANIANLLLASATTRYREMAMRAALGASRQDLIWQMLTESLLLAIAGGALGLFLARMGVISLVKQGPPSIQRTGDVTVDGAVLVFTVLISVAAGLLFGLAPAVLTSHTNLSEWLKDRGTGSSNVRRSGRLRSALVVGEIALAMVLLVVAGLLIRSFVQLREVNVGFDTNNLLTMKLALPGVRYADPIQQINFFDQLLSKVSSLPGVKSAGATSRLHQAETGVGYFLVVEGQPDEGPRNPTARLCIVTRDYLNTLGVRLLQGRMFTEMDKEDAPNVMMISESMARRHFNYPNENPVGKHIAYSKDRTRCEVVGIVSDIKKSASDPQSPDEMYIPYQQKPWLTISLVVRTDGTIKRLADLIRHRVQEIDPTQPVANVRTMDEILGDSRSQPRFTMMLLVIFAATAFFLAVIGIYGVMSYSVKQRTQEFGIRLALGCQAGDILKLVMRQGMILIILGIVLGLLGSFAATRTLGSLLFGVSAADPVTYAGMSLLLCGVALVACLLPAKKATQVDPIIALRSE
jgi:putative ABC transport system permease protein